MTPEPGASDRPQAGRRSWLQRGRAPLGPDIFNAFLFFLVEGWLFFMLAFGQGMAGWAARSATEADAATRAGISHMQYLLCGVLVVAVIAALLRAPWAAGSQLVVALALVMMVSTAQRDYDQAHQPAPSPTPSVYYSPCYSGSGTCH